MTNGEPLPRPLHPDLDLWVDCEIEEGLFGDLASHSLPLWLVWL